MLNYGWCNVGVTKCPALIGSFCIGPMLCKLCDEHNNAKKINKINIQMNIQSRKYFFIDRAQISASLPRCLWLMVNPCNIATNVKFSTNVFKKILSNFQYRTKNKVSASKKIQFKFLKKISVVKCSTHQALGPIGLQATLKHWRVSLTVGTGLKAKSKSKLHYNIH